MKTLQEDFYALNENLRNHSKKEKLVSFWSVLQEGVLHWWYVCASEDKDTDPLQTRSLEDAIPGIEKKNQKQDSIE